MHPELDVPLVKVNPAILRVGRDYVGLELRKAAELVSASLNTVGEPAIDERVLRQWEEGESQPTFAQAEALAEVLLLPFCALLSAAPPRPPVVDFRLGPHGATRSLSYETRKKIEQFSGFYRLAREIALATGTIEEVSVPAPPQALLDDPAVVEEVGQRIRRAIDLTDARQRLWGPDDQALDDLKSAVESSGTFVFTLSMDVDEVRGLSKWERGGPPAVLINAADSVAARIFTLMHEYAHLVVSHAERPFVCDPSQAARGVERVANRIAAAALLPKQLIEPLVVAGERDLAYGDWPPGFRASLRRALHVSHPVIGIRLTDLGLAAGPGRTKSFWRAGGGFGLSRLTMGQRYRKYLGARTMSLAAAALADGRLDPAGASRTLGIPTKHFEAALQA